MHQATACKTVSLASSFSCALKNKGLEMLTFLGEKWFWSVNFLLLDHRAIFPPAFLLAYAYAMQVIIYNWEKQAMQVCVLHQVRVLQSRSRWRLWRTNDRLVRFCFSTRLQLMILLMWLFYFFSLRYIGQNDLSPFYNSYYATLFKYTHNLLQFIVF